jgi:flagellar hook assembly protein FlgD
LQRVLSTVVLVGLLLATAAAFAITEHLKLIKSPIYGTRVTKAFSPVCHCATAKAKISFKLRRADVVTVAIVTTGRDPVATVRSAVSEQAGRVTFFWYGRTDAGAVAPDGQYQPQVTLANARRSITMPNKITVDTTAPKVVSASDGAGVLTTGGHHTIVILYDFSQRAHAAVFVGGERVILGRSSRPRDGVKWDGKRDGRTLPPGRYVLEIAAVDDAGNVTLPADRKQVVVRIRSIVLSVTSIRVAAGAHFTVGVHTGAPTYTWRLAGRNGTGHKDLLRLRAPSTTGRYRLVVSEGGHSATALVIVKRK